MQKKPRKPKKNRLSRPRHKFNDRDRAKARESAKPLTYGEAKRLLSDRLRDKKTDAQSFTRLLEIYLQSFRKTGRLKKKQAEPETSVEEMVRQLEAEERDGKGQS